MIEFVERPVNCVGTLALLGPPKFCVETLELLELVVAICDDALELFDRSKVFEAALEVLGPSDTFNVDGGKVPKLRWRASSCKSCSALLIKQSSIYKRIILLEYV